jgi:ferrochelatase
MKYTAINNFTHDRAAATGVLVVNLGTPDAPTPAAVRRYLAQFLSDPRVVEFPRLPWWLVLHGVILRIRPGKVAHAYASIWTEDGSPLLVESQRIANRLQTAVNAQFPGPVHVELAMCYGNPGIPQGLENLRRKNVERLLILPLYPQYSATTTAAVYDAIATQLKQWRWLPELRMLMQYHDHPLYINAIANQIQDGFARHGKPDKLLMSFHGIPQRYLHAGDPYHCHCHKTARLVADTLKLQPHEWQLCFQSRFGREPWLQPYADHTLIELAKQGIGHVQIIAPGFAADCLETLEELAMQNRALFLEHGGKHYHYLPALNDSDKHIELLTQLVEENGGGWSQIDSSFPRIDNELSCRLAIAQGAKN